MPTKMEVVLKECVACAHDLYVATRDNKLSPGSFMSDALAFNNVSATRLDELESVLQDTAFVTDAVSQFIRRCEKLVEENSPCPSPPDKMAKIASAFGSPALLGELALCRFTIGEAYCLATRISVTKHADKFGTVSDWDKHLALIEKLKERKATLLLSMTKSLRPADLVLTDDGAWLAGMHVKLQKGWPEQLLEHACRKPKAKKARVQLESRAAA